MCALASKKRTVSKRGFLIPAGLNLLGCARGPKQNPSSDCMAAGRAVKVLLATRPRALLRSTLTARPSAKMRCQDFVLGILFFQHSGGSIVSEFKPIRRLVVQSTVEPLPVVKHFNVFKEGAASLLAGGKTPGLPIN